MRIDTKLYTGSGMKVHHLSEIATSRAHRIDASACGSSNALPISKSEPYIALTCLTCPPIQASNSKPLNLKKRGQCRRQPRIGTGWHCIWWQDVAGTTPNSQNECLPYGNPTETLREPYGTAGFQAPNVTASIPMCYGG